MGIVLFFLFLVLPFLELVVLLQVGALIGPWWTFGLMILSAVVGSWLCKREGLGVLRRINTALDEGRLPTNELADGGLILLAGALMVAPGFITDLTGILLLFPPTRALVRTVLVKRMRVRVERAVATGAPAGFTFIRTSGFAGGSGGPFGFDPFGGSGRGPHGEDVIDVESWEQPVDDDRFGRLPGGR